MILEYLKGLSIILLLIGYIIGFNYLWNRFTNEKPNDIFGYVLLPFIIPTGICLILALPLIIQS